MKRIYLISPNHRATGGVELLHQFVHEANQHGDCARIVYFPFGRVHEQPEVYEKYSSPQSSIEEVDHPHSVVIVPETLTHLVRRFKQATVYIWWLSVDNYFGSQKLRFLAANKVLPFTHWKMRPNARVRHLAQSQYAIEFLASRGVHGARLLTDYLNPDFIEAARDVELSSKRDVVLYNPAKGMERTSKVLRLLPAHIQAIALQGMTRPQMVETLATAKVYIDFGNHPGKDRIPREAAIMGCCVMTNRRGSAANGTDVPISDHHKIDDTQPDFAAEAAQQVTQLVAQYRSHENSYEPYRRMIEGEQAAFADQVRQIVLEAHAGHT